MVRRLLFFLCIGLLGQGFLSLEAAQERQRKGGGKTPVAKSGVKPKQPKPTPVKQKVIGVVPKKVVVAPSFMINNDLQIQRDKIALSIESIFQNIEQNYKTFTRHEYKVLLAELRGLIQSLDIDVTRYNQLVNRFNQAHREYEIRKELLIRKPAPKTGNCGDTKLATVVVANQAAAQPRVALATAATLAETPKKRSVLLQAQVDVLKKQLEEKELALKLLQENLEKQKNESELSFRNLEKASASAINDKVVVIESAKFVKNLAYASAKTIASAFIFAASPPIFCLPIIDATTASPCAEGYIYFAPDETSPSDKFRNFAGEDALRNLDRIKRQENAELFTEYLQMPTFYEYLYSRCPDATHHIDTAWCSYHRFCGVKYQEYDFSQQLINIYYKELKDGIAAINAFLSNLQLTEPQRTRLENIRQLFVAQQNYLQQVLKNRCDALFRYTADLEGKDLAMLHQLAKDLKQEHDQLLQEYNHHYELWDQSRNKILMCRLALAKYNNLNQKMFGYYINCVWDKFTRGKTQEDYWRILSQCSKEEPSLAKNKDGFEVRLAMLRSKQGLVQDAIMSTLEVLRSRFECPSSPFQKRIVEALDQTLVQQGALQVTKLNLAPDVLHYLKELGFDVQDFDSFEVNGFQKALIDESVEIITFCANHRSEDPAIMPYLDLAGAAATGTIQQIQYIKPEAAFDMIEWAHYLKDCYGDFKHRAKSAFWESFNVPAMAKGVVQLLDMIGRFDEHGTLLQIDLLAAKHDNFTPEQQRNMAIMLLEHQEYTKFVANAYVKMWQQNFKDGKLRGVCRIAGNLTGNLAGGAVFGELSQAAAACRLPYAPALKSLHRILVLEGERLAPIFNNQNLALHAEFACPEEFAPVIKNVDAFIREELPGAVEQQVIETVAPMSESVAKAIEQVIEKVKPLIKEQVHATGITDTIVEEICCKNSGLAEYINTAELSKAVELIAKLEKHITHLRRDFKINGITYQMKSGHSYFRRHLGGGDCRTIGSLNEIEEAIIKDMLDRKCLDLVAEGFTEKFKVSFKDIVIEYEPFKGSKSFCSIDYYPLITKGS